MLKIILCKGLPASGKSTFAINHCENTKSWKRINKDDIREKYSEEWSPELEKKILNEERQLGISYLHAGYNLIVDDTNLHPKHEAYWREVASVNGWEFSIKFFDVALDVCIERDSKRTKSVGAKVIKDMYYRYIHKKEEIKSDNRKIMIQDHSLTKTVIVDIDGTLALMNNRSPFDYMAAGKDFPNVDLFRLIETLAKDSKIILLSGREETSREVTENWLKKYGFPKWEMLLMRAEKDYRPDDVIKKELFDTHIKDKYYIMAVFDDRDKVVKMWRDMGLLCLQVYYGDF